MSRSCSIPPDWTLPTALASPSHRQVECLPAEPLSEHHLAALLRAESVSEVWLPVSHRRSSDPANGLSERSIRDVWVAFADRLHAIRYERPSGQCPLAWYRALRPIETSDRNDLIEELTDGYTRLSERPAGSE